MIRYQFFQIGEASQRSHAPVCRRPKPRIPGATRLSVLDPGLTTAMLLDWNNLHVGARKLGRDFDGAALLRAVRHHIPATRAIALMSAREEERNRQTRRLERAGYSVLSEASRTIAGRTKADMDASLGAIATAVVLRHKVRQLVLVSGDSDFAGMLKVLRALADSRLRVVVIGLRGSMATVLRKQADAVVEVGEDVVPMARRQRRVS